MMKRQNYDVKDHTFAVCAYKESNYLEACIISLLNQSVRSNIIIATSTPNARIQETADKYHLKLYVNNNGGSIAADWNYALEAAKTPLVTLAHQDDIYEEDYLKEILQVINRCRHPLIAFTNYRELRDDRVVDNNKVLRVKRILLSPLRIRALWNSRFVRRRVLSLGSAICCPSVTLVKRNLRLPVFKNNMKSNIDWQAWEKISKSKGAFAYVSRPLMLHRIHEESETTKVIGQSARKEEDLIMYRKFWPEWIADFLEYFYQKSEKSNENKPVQGS